MPKGMVISSRRSGVGQVVFPRALWGGAQNVARLIGACLRLDSAIQPLTEPLPEFAAAASRAVDALTAALEAQIKAASDYAVVEEKQLPGVQKLAQAVAERDAAKAPTAVFAPGDGERAMKSRTQEIVDVALGDWFKAYEAHNAKLAARLSTAVVDSVTACRVEVERLELRKLLDPAVPDGALGAPDRQGRANASPPWQGAGSSPAP